MATEQDNITTTLQTLQTQLDALNQSQKKVIGTPALGQGSTLVKLSDIPQGAGSQLDSDYVDGIHASFKPQPNCLVPLGSDGTFPASTLPGSGGGGGSGILPTNVGGTGQSTYTDGQILIGDTTTHSLDKSTITGTTHEVIVTNGHGSITLSTPQAIDTTSSPTFSSLTLSSPLNISSGGTGTSTQFTTGSIVFAGASGVYTQNNSNLFWDNTNTRLGILTNSPDSILSIFNTTPGSTTNTLHIKTNSSTQYPLYIEDTSHSVYLGLNAGGGAKNAAWFFQNAGVIKWYIGNNNNESGDVFSIFNSSNNIESIACNHADKGVGISLTSGTTPTSDTFEVGIASQFDLTLSVTGNVTLSGTSNSVGTITSGTWHGTKIGLLYGGTNSDLSSTGGTSQVLKQSSSGASITVGQLAFTDLSGILSVSQGGTGQDFHSIVQGDILYFSATGTLSALATGTSGYFLKTNGSSANPSWAQVINQSSTAPTVQVFTSGTGTYTTPAGVNHIKVTLIGGGGGGGGGNGASAGSTGVDTTFGTSLLIGNGGSGGTAGQTVASGGNASGGQINIVGSPGGGQVYFSSVVNSYLAGGMGGSSQFGSGGVGIVNLAGSNAGANTGAGGGGGGTGNTNGIYSGGGGGSGGSVISIISSPNSTYSYAVGSGGSGAAGGTNGFSGGNGGSGIIIVEEYYNA